MSEKILQHKREVPWPWCTYLEPTFVAVLLNRHSHTHTDRGNLTIQSPSIDHLIAVVMATSPCDIVGVQCHGIDPMTMPL